jgi:hypothetical protein
MLTLHISDILAMTTGIIGPYLMNPTEYVTFHLYFGHSFSDAAVL